MAGPGNVSTPAVAAAGVGALVLWAAMKGVGVMGGLRSLLTGKQPVSTHSEDITGSSGGPPAAAAPVASSTATGSVVANDGLSYVGTGTVYRWGGGDVKGWDCSGFVNYVVGHDLRSPIPGSRSGSYSGHGPTTVQWKVFGTKIARKDVQAGDLVVWLTHMGIAVSNSQMVNCPGPNGSPAPIVSGFDNTGIPGPVSYRRIGVTYGGPH